MYIQENSLKILNGEAQFWMLPNSGIKGFPVNVGLSQLREMREVLGRIETKLVQHLAERDVAELFDDDRKNSDRLLDDVSAEHLPERIAASAAVAEEEDGERMSADRFE